MKFISQKGQDEWVIGDVFHSKQNGFFLDLAAGDGIKDSNTYLLEKALNWRGICIEPNPTFYEQLRKNRSCRSIRSCIDGRQGLVDFRIDNGECGGVVADDTDNSWRVRGEQLKRAYLKNGIITVETKTLKQVLAENDAPPVIDYFSFDVEGSETRILKDFPFQQYTFLALTVERPTPELNRILFANDYVFVMNSKRTNPYDTYYVHKSISNLADIKKEPFLQVPPKDW